MKKTKRFYYFNPLDAGDRAKARAKAEGRTYYVQHTGASRMFFVSANRNHVQGFPIMMYTWDGKYHYISEYDGMLPARAPYKDRKELKAA